MHPRRQSPWRCARFGPTPATLAASSGPARVVARSASLETCRALYEVRCSCARSLDWLRSFLRMSSAHRLELVVIFGAPFELVSMPSTVHARALEHGRPPEHRRVHVLIDA